MVWKIDEAKENFGELVRRVEVEGPQTVARNGEEVVVIVPAREWREKNEGEMDFKEFLMSAPEGLEMIEVERPKNDFPKNVHLEKPDPPKRS